MHILWLSDKASSIACSRDAGGWACVNPIHVTLASAPDAEHNGTSLLWSSVIAHKTYRHTHLTCIQACCYVCHLHVLEFTGRCTFRTRLTPSLLLARAYPLSL